MLFRYKLIKGKSCRHFYYSGNELSFDRVKPLFFKQYGLGLASAAGPELGVLQVHGPLLCNGLVQPHRAARDDVTQGDLSEEAYPGGGGGTGHAGAIYRLPSAIQHEPPPANSGLTAHTYPFAIQVEMA